MTSKKTLEYCAPEVKEIALNIEGSYLLTGSEFGDKNKAGKDLDEDDDYTYDM